MGRYHLDRDVIQQYQNEPRNNKHGYASLWLG